jgi:hypothetical protein
MLHRSAADELDRLRRELAEKRELLERAEKWRDYYRAKWLGPAACPQPEHPDDAIAAAKATPSPSAPAEDKS